MKRARQFTLGAAAMLLAGLLAIGCSDNQQNPLASAGAPANTSDNGIFGSPTSAEIYGRVGTIDAANRTLTIAGSSAQVSVLSGAEIVLKTSSNETPIQLSSINPGDSIEVRGDFTGPNAFLADRVRKRDSGTSGGGVSGEVEFGGRVATIDATARTMTFVGRDQTVQVAAGAEIVERGFGMERLITLAEIDPGDSVEVRGRNQADGSLLADRVRLRTGSDNGAFGDVEFYGTIATIDYAAGTLTVNSRGETITTDAITVILSELGRRSSGAVLSEGDDSDKLPITFDQLLVGDSVEIHAQTVDAATLLATRIEVEDDGNGDDSRIEVEFKAVISSIDLDTRTVTFFSQDGVGTVLESAILLGYQDEPITLDQFFVCEIVEVRGVQTAIDAFTITEMRKDNSF